MFTPPIDLHMIKHKRFKRWNQPDLFQTILITMSASISQYCINWYCVILKSGVVQLNGLHDKQKQITSCKQRRTDFSDVAEAFSHAYVSTNQ